MITYTTDQKNAIEKLQAFFKSNDNVFILKGSAGTGKTTLLHNVIRESNLSSYSLIAPTGRAALILGRKVGQRACTIHRKIYNISKLEFENDDIKIESEDEEQSIFILKANEDNTNHIYFIDEASMISSEYSDNETVKFGSGCLLQDLIEYCNLKTTNRKIVFVGDYAQLPPVGQNFSPALQEEYLRDTFKLTVQDVMIRQVVRQVTDSGIYINATLIRDCIEDKIFNKFAISSHQDVVKLPSGDFIDTYLNHTSNKIDVHTIIITFSNRQALEYNLALRPHFFGNNTLLNKGELLLVVQNNYSNGAELFNGSIIKLEEFDDKVEMRNIPVGKDWVNLSFRDVTVTFATFDGAVTLRYKILDDVLTCPERQLSTLERKALYVDFVIRMGDNGIKKGSSAFKKLIKTDPYFNVLMCKYGYAITCHKAQGGEWNNAFVDMAKTGGKSNEDYFRWAYTAITRGKENMWLANTPNLSQVNQLIIKPIGQKSNINIPIACSSVGGNYLDVRSENIASICKSLGVNYTEDRCSPYQHNVFFTEANKSCHIRLWYTEKNYSRIIVMNKSDDEFTRKCLGICNDSLTTANNINIDTLKPFQKLLYDSISDAITDLDIKLINIETQEWHDLYFFVTPTSKIEIRFSYNSTETYTSAQPDSTLGLEDKSLVELLTAIGNF